MEVSDRECGEDEMSIDLGGAPCASLDTIDEDVSKSFQSSMNLSREKSDEDGGKGASDGVESLSPGSFGEEGEEEDPLGMTMRLPKGQSFLSFALEESVRMRLEKGWEEDDEVTGEGVHGVGRAVRREKRGGLAVEDDIQEEEAVEEEENSSKRGGMRGPQEHEQWSDGRREDEASAQDVFEFCSMMLERRLPFLVSAIFSRMGTGSVARKEGTQNKHKEHQASVSTLGAHSKSNDAQSKCADVSPGNVFSGKRKVDDKIGGQGGVEREELFLITRGHELHGHDISGGILRLTHQPQVQDCQADHAAEARAGTSGGLQFPEGSGSVEKFLDSIKKQLGDEERSRRRKNDAALTVCFCFFVCLCFFVYSFQR